MSCRLPEVPPRCMHTGRQLFFSVGLAISVGFVGLATLEGMAETPPQFFSPGSFSPGLDRPPDRARRSVSQLAHDRHALLARVGQA